MRRLRRAMSHRADAALGEECEDLGAIADIQCVVRETLHLPEELLPAPQRVTLRTEEIGPHVVVDTVYAMTKSRKVLDSFRTYESAGAGNHDFHDIRLAKLELTERCPAH